MISSIGIIKRAQLIQLHAVSEQALDDVQTVIKYLQSLLTTKRDYHCEVIKLVKPDFSDSSYQCSELAEN